MDVLKSEPHSPPEKFRILCDDGDEVVGVKFEEFTDIKVEGDPEPVKVEEVSFIKEEDDPEVTTFTEIKNEPAVSCMTVCVCLCS